ncbi:ras GTPase-activating protein 2-like [Bolinopsis microptera]|uniref:ras GTPase-activating protein 2-like n=1 Tax=Bolinopsis microptera TaxID=2820187 RepID=UPI00307AF927
MASTVDRPVRHGMLTKRSISKSKTTFNAKFQERWFVLTDKTLTYHTPNGHSEKGRISVDCIRCCELVEEETFNRPRLFQVVYSDKEKLRALYLQSDTKQTQEEWIQCIRLVSEKSCPERMLSHYHSGAYIKKKWSCCHKTEKHYDSGCENTYVCDRISDMGIDPRRASMEAEARRASNAADQQRHTIKRKLSLQNMMHSLKLDKSDKTDSLTHTKSISSETHEEEDVFSDGELSDDEGGSFKTKHSLDSSGNSPRY